MTQFVIQTELFITVDPGPNDNVENMKLEAIRQWNDLIWRHYTCHTSKDLNDKLSTRIWQVEGT